MKKQQREQGYALLLVLVTLALLALVMGRLALAARQYARDAVMLRDQSIAQAAADGGVAAAIFRLLPLTGSAKIGAAQQFTVPVGGHQVLIQVSNLAGRVNLNTAPPQSVARLLMALGAQDQAAEAMAEKIIDWRSINTEKEPQGAKIPEYRALGKSYGPPNENYQSLDELSLVAGIPVNLLRALARHVTVHGEGATDLTMADDFTKQAYQGKLPLGALSQNSDTASLSVLDISATTDAGGTPAVRHAVIRFDTSADNGGKFWEILDWD